MTQESRTKRVTLRMRPSLHATIAADADAKGQSLAEWFERLIEEAMARKERDSVCLAA